MHGGVRGGVHVYGVDSSCLRTVVVYMPVVYSAEYMCMRWITVVYEL